MSAKPGLQMVLSREARVVLLTAGGKGNDEAIRGELQESVDWARLSWLAEWERATGVIWRRLSTVAPARIPSDVAHSWERLAMIADFQGTYLRDRFVETLRAFAADGIEVVLLKGVALAYSAYPTFTERPMGDVDVLIAPSDAQRAWKIATGMGWTWDRAAYPEARYEEHHHLPPLSDSRRTGAKLEIHTALSVFGHPYSLGFDAVRRNARPVMVAGIPACVLDESHQVVHLAVHFAWSHMLSFGAWRMFRDLDALLSTGRVDWNAVEKIARTHGSTSCCHWTLRLAADLVGIAVPAEAIARMHAPTPFAVRNLIERHLSTQLFATERRCPSEAMRRLMWSAAIRPGRLRLGEGRPWDIDEVVIPGGSGRKSVGQRVAHQLENAMEWAHYIRLVGVPRGGR